MHRALGGAPTFSVQWRSLGRSLRGNAVRVRRVRRSTTIKKSTVAACVLASLSLHLKNKFFRKEARPLPLHEQKKARGRGMPRLLRSGLQNKSMGRAWCGHARPTTTIAPAKFGAGKFCRFKEQKR